MEVARKAVETNFVMLWEYTPAQGLHFSQSVDHPLPVTEYLKVMGRFRHLTEEQVQHIQAKVEENRAFVQQISQQSYAPREYVRLAGLGGDHDKGNAPRR